MGDDARQICGKCGKHGDCEEPCAALEELGRIYDEKDAQIKRLLIMSLARKLGRHNADRSKELEELGRRVLQAFPTLPAARARIGYVLSHETKTGGGKITLGDCRKTDEVERAFLPFDYIITFYARNIRRMGENQKKLLMLHELRHIIHGVRGWMIAPHEVEDFESILMEFGIRWSALDNRDALPDILAGLERDTHGKRKGGKKRTRKGRGEA